ncbi:MAG: hypothetical protein EA398_11275 [Deltaproteobacteria bacterium]|nr:MAG: hypothetical protein EA398_11275 [Deltaproteobacteria bacterium]
MSRRAPDRDRLQPRTTMLLRSLALALLIPAALVLALAGCADETQGGGGAGDDDRGGRFGPPPSGEVPGQPGSGCETNAECAGTLECIDGRCAATCGGETCEAPTPLCDEVAERCVECLRDTQCDDGFVCDDGVCFPRCALDGCEDGEVCDPETGACLSADCSAYPPCPDNTCDGNLLVRCEPNAAGCPVRVDRDCGAEGGACQQTAAGAECRIPCATDGDCAEGESCQGGFCQPSCRTDADCSDGNPCTLNRCEAGSCTVAEVQDRDDAPDDRAGDCRRPVCEAGEVRYIPDNEDRPPDDGIACTVPACDDGTPIYRPDNARCDGDDVCFVQGGGCVPRDEVPDNVCIPTQHDYDYFLDPQCGDGIADQDCPCEFGSVQRCFMGPPTARGVGACADGTQICQNRLDPRWGPCSGSLTPQPEVCDGRDNACDGCVDNIPNCAPVVNCPDNEVTQPFRHYELDAQSFFDDVITEVNWIVRPPPNSNAGVPENPTSPQTRFYMDVSGDYLVTIQITDDKNTTFACSWIVSAEGEGLRVELVWDTFGSVDMDLHLLRDVPGATFCTANDCYYANCRAGRGTGGANWGYAPSPGEACNRGAGQTCPNPRLDIDNIRGQDPENINVDNPNDGDSFRVMVHMFSGTRTTRNTVSIYCGGSLRAVFGEAPDFAITNRSGSGCGGHTWRVADVIMRVDPGTGATSCDIVPLAGPDGYDIRLNTSAR